MKMKVGLFFVGVFMFGGAVSAAQGSPSKETKAKESQATADNCKKLDAYWDAYLSDTEIEFDYKRVKSLAISCTKGEPKNAKAWSSLGDAYRNLNEDAKAAGAYEKAVELMPWSVSDKLNLALLYFKLNKTTLGKRSLDEAYKEFKPIGDRFGDNISLRQFVEAYADNGYVDEAEQVVNRISEIYPSDQRMVNWAEDLRETIVEPARTLQHIRKLEYKAAGWKHVASYPDGGIVFVDGRSIRRKNDGQRTAWVLTEYVEQQWDEYIKKYYSSKKTMWRFDCNERSSAALSYVEYADSMGAGALIDSYSVAPEKVSSQYVVPDSVGEATLDHVCKAKPAT